MVVEARAVARALDDAQLRASIATRSEQLRHAQAELAEFVAELAERTQQAIRAAGRSEKAGPAHSTLEVQRLTGLNRHQARGLIDAGELLGSARVDEGAVPGDSGAATDGGEVGDRATARGWLGLVAEALRRAVISVEKANLIRSGFDGSGERISVEELTLAVRELVELAPSLTPEQLRAEVRIVREQLDHQYVVDEERRIQDARSVVLRRHGDGSGTLIARLDRESTVLVAELLDGATGPKRFGPRFTTTEANNRAAAVADDSRSIDQLAHDTLLTIVRLGLAADPNLIPGRQPAVRIVVTANDLTNNTGYGELEGTGRTVGIDTVQRHLCDTGSATVTIDHRGQPLNYGRDRRLFSEQQRRALALRDGGCMDPDCDRPASWCEAHHLIPWQAGGGKTDLSNGILLCRYHHLDLHNRGARISHDQHHGTHIMHEPDGTSRTLRSKARIHERLRAG